jgi:hypothetical protein
MAPRMRVTGAMITQLNKTVSDAICPRGETDVRSVSGDPRNCKGVYLQCVKDNQGNGVIANLIGDM